MIPGNHDYGSNGIFEGERSFKMFHEILELGEDYPKINIHDSIAFISLDSMEQEMREYEFWGAQGKIGRQQLINLDHALDEFSDNKNVNKIVVALHHHPFYYNRWLALRDAKEFKSVIGKNDEHNGRIDCLVFGHKHGRHMFTKKEKKYDIPIIYASHKSTSIAVGKGRKAVYKISIIDVNTNKIDLVEIKA